MFILDLGRKGFIVDSDKQKLKAMENALGYKGIKGKFLDAMTSAFGARLNPEAKKSTQVQSVIFSKKCYTPQQAQKWLKKHNFKIKKMDTTDDYYRFRQLSPLRFEEFRTIDFTDHGCIKAIIGIPF